MKKILLFGLFVAMTFSMSAQHDTLPYYIGMPQFYMDHPLSDMHDTSHNGAACSPAIYSTSYAAWATYSIPMGDILNGDFAIGFYPDSLLHVIGIAVPFGWAEWSHPDHTFSDYLSNLYSILNYTDYNEDSLVFRIYQPIGNRLSLLESVTLDTTFDTATCRLYQPMECSLFPPQYPYRPQIILEAYFDNELDLTDSFYVSYNQIRWDSLPLTLISGYKEAHDILVDTSIYPLTSFRIIGNILAPDDPCIYGEYPFYPVVWPIIRRDCDTCPTVQGLQVFRSSATQSFFRWQRGEGHRDWQLSYGPVGTDPDDGIKLDYKQAMSGIIDFSPDTQYVAYVRARCRFGGYAYSPWSAPVYVNQNGEGIDAAGAEQFTLSPNPAAGQVTVSASQGIRMIEVYDTRGAKVYSQTMATDRWTLTTEEWPAGQYIVTVETAAGTTSKVLIIER